MDYILIIIGLLIVMLITVTYIVRRFSKNKINYRSSSDFYRSQVDRETKKRNHD